MNFRIVGLACSWCPWILFVFFTNIICWGESSVLVDNKDPGIVELPSTYRPTILSPANSISVLVGSTVLFPCRVDRIDSFSLLWKHGTTSILFVGTVSANKDRHFSLLDDNSLRIRDVTPEHSGDYICQVSSNPPTEVIHRLRVLVPPTVSTVPRDGHVIAKKGDPVTMRCNAEGFPPPVITWKALKGSLPGGNTEKQGAVLTIPSIDNHHSGSYQCTAENDVEEPAIAIFKVTVLYAPEVVTTPKLVHAGIGSTVELTCTVEAEPHATTLWIRSSGSALDDDSHVSQRTVGHSHVMRIRPISDEHFGSYRCIANNSLGSTEDTVEVSGLAEPVTFKSNTSGEYRTSFLLVWTVKSYSPIIEYVLKVRAQKEEGSSPKDWNDVIIPVHAEHRLFYSDSYNVTGLEPGTGYEVVMLARNDFGWNHPSDTFTFYTFGREPVADGRENTDSEPVLLPPQETATYNEEIDPKENESSDGIDSRAKKRVVLSMLTVIILSFFFL